MADLPNHLKQESIDLTNQLNHIKLKLNSLQKRVKDHQNDTNQSILVCVTPSTPNTVSSINPYASIVNDAENIKKTDSINPSSAKQLILPSKSLPIKPTQKMKNIHWNAIKLEQIQESIWSQINQNWADFEPQNFEQHFQANMCEPVRFLSVERSMQVQHGLHSLHLTNEELLNIILTLDETRVDSKALELLIDIIPTSKEQSQAFQLSQHKNIRNFAAAERFFYCLSDIKELRSRLKHWLFKLEFDEKLRKLNDNITVIEKAKLAVSLSKDFRQILAIILAFGNYMNYGDVHTRNCYGFSLSDLYILPTIKTFGSNPIPFLQFLCSFLQKKYPTLLNNIIGQFKIVGTASKINCQNIDDEYYSLLQSIQDLQSMVASYKNKYFGILGVHDMYIEKMIRFEKTVRNAMWKLKFRVDSYHKCQAQLIKYFVYDTQSDDKPIKIQQIFKDIYGFIQMLELAKNKLHQQQIESVMNMFSVHNNIYNDSNEKKERPTRCSNIYAGLFENKSATKKTNSESGDTVTPNADFPPNFNRNRRKTETLRLALDVLEIQSNCSSDSKGKENKKENKKTAVKTPSVIRHKSVEARMNKFISQTPSISHCHPSPYKHAAKRIMAKKRMSLKINEMTPPTPAVSPCNFTQQKAKELKKNKFPNTPLLSKSYINPYKLVVGHTGFNTNHYANLTKTSIIEE